MRSEQCSVDTAVTHLPRPACTWSSLFPLQHGCCTRFALLLLACFAAVLSRVPDSGPSSEAERQSKVWHIIHRFRELYGEGIGRDLVAGFRSKADQLELVNTKGRELQRVKVGVKTGKWLRIKRQVPTVIPGLKSVVSSGGEIECMEFNKEARCFWPAGPVKLLHSENAPESLCSAKMKHTAIVTAFDFQRNISDTEFKRLANKGEVAVSHGAKYIMLVPQNVSIDANNRKKLEKTGLKLHEVPWMVPPRLSRLVPRESGGCCGAREFIKLHAFNLTEFDAIIFYDTDVEVRSDVPEVLSPLFRCAASGYFLTTPAPKHFPWVNSGFFAVRPHAKLFEAMLDVLSGAKVRHTDGWNKAGWGPKNKDTSRAIKDQFRMQGFLQYFMYQDTRHTQYVEAKQLDQCIWNRQRGSECDAVPCAATLVFHQSEDCGS